MNSLKNLKLLVLLIATAILFSCNQKQQSKNKIVTLPKAKEINQIVEASCGQCNFGLKGQKGCDLAVRIKGKSYFVDGTDIDDHGDAHAKEGFCNAISKAQVTGTIVNGRFKAISFKLVDEKITL